MSEHEDIPGWSRLVDWFGFEPDFHDAEVLAIDFRRAPLPTTLTIYTWRMTPQTDDDGFYLLDRHARVSFVLEGMAIENFGGWNHQNVLNEISVTRQVSGSAAGQRFMLHLHATYGLHATFTADSITVKLIPGEIKRPAANPGWS